MAYFYDLETLRPHRTTPVPVRLDRRPSVRHQIHRSASSISDQHQASGLVSLSICANTPKSSTHVATCGTLCAPGVSSIRSHIDVVRRTSSQWSIDWTRSAATAGKRRSYTVSQNSGRRLRRCRVREKTSHRTLQQALRGSCSRCPPIVDTGDQRSGLGWPRNTNDRTTMQSSVACCD